MSSISLNPVAKRWWPWAVAGCVCVAGALYLFNGAQVSAPSPLSGNGLAHEPTASDAKDASDTGGMPQMGLDGLSGAPASPQSPLESVKPPQFRADAKGQLVVNEAFRTDLERVYGLHHGPNVLRKLEEFSAHLPDSAKQELRNQYHRYVQYDAALTQSMAALHAQGEFTLETAERELTTLHELRQTYFGQDGAQAMFAQEEAHSQELHDYIRNHTDPALPLLERVELAQAAWLKAREEKAASTTRPSN